MTKINICGDIKHPPFEFIDENGEIAGFNVDITKEIGKIMDLDIQIHLKDWQTSIEEMDKGIYDGIQGMSVNDDREFRYLFGPNYITTSHSVFALKKREDIKDIINLTNTKNYKIAAQENDAGLFILNKRRLMENDTEAIKVSSQEEGIKLLMKEEVDLVVGNKLTILYYAQELGIDRDIKLIGNPLRLTKYGIAFSKKNKNLADIFIKGMKMITENGQYEKIYSKWFQLNKEYFEKQIIENVETGVIYLDKLGKITAINNFAKNILRLTREDAILKSVYETEISEIFNMDIIQKMLDGIEDSFSSEIKIEIENEIRYLDVNYTKLYDAKNNFMGLLINFEDITDKIKIQRILARKDKMESLGVLLLNMGHELRNPLTSIKNFIELIPKHIDDEEFRESLLFHVPNQINYINELFSVLLEYSKPQEANKLNINIKNLVESDLIKYINKFTYKDIQLETGIVDDFIIMADFNQMKQIFINLITNSVEAIEGNGIIKIYTDEDEENKIINIEDNGKGILSEDISKIFDPFFTTRENGTGLGLFITYHLMKENNGDIEFTRLDSATKVSLIFKKN